MVTRMRQDPARHRYPADRRLELRIPTALYTAVWQRAEREGRSVSWVVRDLLRAWVDSPPAPPSTRQVTP